MPDALTPMLAPHQLDRARVAHKDHLIVEGNWKLMMENSRECYHCAAEHRDLMRTFLDIYDWSNPAEAAEIKAYIGQREAEGLPSQVVEGPEYRASRLPFTNGATSITMDGKPAVSRLLGAVPHNDIGSLRWVHYPTVFNHALGDYAVMVNMMPLDPQRTMVSTTWLVDRDAVLGEHYDLENLIRVWKTTNEEDGGTGRTQPARGELGGLRARPLLACPGSGRHQVRRLVLRADHAPSRPRPGRADRRVGHFSSKRSRLGRE